MKLTFLSFLPMVFLVACSGLFPSPLVTETPGPTQTSTATTLWFPSTNTPTPFISPTVQPTEMYHSGVGSLLFADSFNKPADWDTSISDRASAIIDRNRLLLSLGGQGPLSISSMRSQPPLLDFYAEATATISLCSGRDQYGMVFRAGQGFYRITLNCSGQVRLERGASGTITPLLLWLNSGDVPSGPPGDVKIGVWAMGSELRIYLNDHFQFSSSDPNPQAGRLGFYVFANSTQPVTVAFSDLSVYTVFKPSPTPSPTASLTPTP
jgi:hypothetical protein